MESKVNFVFVECQAALGMESGEIRDRQISASSEYNSNHGAILGRLHFQKSAGAWCAGRNNAHQWLQVDLRRPHRVIRVATQGRSNNNQWVTMYKLQYGNSAGNLRYYREHGQTTDKVKYTVQSYRTYRAKSG